MFSDRSASQLHLFANRKSCESLVRVIKFEGAAFPPQAVECDRNSDRRKQRINPETMNKLCQHRRKSINFPCILPERLRSRFRTPKGRCRGVPGPSPEAPERSPSPPGAFPGRLRSTPGARPERPTRATGHRRPQDDALGPQKAHSGGPRHLKKELPGPIFRALGSSSGTSPHASFQSSPPTQASRGRR